ncbi:hypothetical protein HQ32_04923 [Prauserella sp. Am3]|nr:hypothetical protein HQ32_04923 [Prauserella sp. Am3]
MNISGQGPETGGDQPVEIRRVNEQLSFPKASLVEPVSSGFIYLGAEIDPIWPFGLRRASRGKREAMSRSMALTARLEQLDSVLSAKVLVAHFIPPGQGKELGRRKQVHQARFDLVVLIETTDMESAADLQQHELYRELVTLLEQRADHMHVVCAHNRRSMGAVDKGRDGIFLFNYFHADDPAKLIPVWEYTAGWFEANTGLDNSTLLEPAEGEHADYGIINHCRWDRWRDVLPHLRLRPSFRRYVLAHFYANGIVPMPILYRLVANAHAVEVNS